MSIKDNHINYVEFKAKNLKKIKEFYNKSFDWTFTDYGPTYIAFSESGLEGGFEKTEYEIVNGALIVLYHQNLDSVKNKILKVFLRSCELINYVNNVICNYLTLDNLKIINIILRLSNCFC